MSHIAGDDGLCDESNPSLYPKLGAELWAYVPYNILPHLQGLTRTQYKHKYFVDLRPRIFDVQIFPMGTDDPDFPDHPNGWGTILVCGMRLGGAAIEAKELDGAITTDTREFVSSYFIFDITNPEKEPKLLGELTRPSLSEPFVDANGNDLWDVGEGFTDQNNNNKYDAEPFVDMGHSTNIATMVLMKKDGALVNTPNNQWYLAIGSGPHGPDAMKGVSDQAGKLAILPLNPLVSNHTLTIPNNDLSTFASDSGIFPLSDQTFISDAITIDLDIDPSSADYMADAVYFGTVEGNFVFDETTQASNWVGGGKFYRLVTRNLDSEKSYYGTSVTQTTTTPQDWKLKLLMDVGRPITSAPSVSYDGYNFWIYGGTGRFYDADDKQDTTQQAYFGIKEPMLPYDADGDGDAWNDDISQFTWKTIPAPNLDQNTTVFPVAGNDPGEKGLLRVDEIQVQQAADINSAWLSCDLLNDPLNDYCLPSQLPVPLQSQLPDPSHLGNLVEYIAGKGRTTDPSYSQSADGWYKEFYPYHDDRQRNLGQPTILGGLLLFTTYQPFSGLCQAEGLSYLYGVYYQTGTSWYEPVFGETSVTNGKVENQLFLGQGLAETPNLFVGQGADGKVSAYVQTSTGEIKGIAIENLPLKNYYTGRAAWKNTCGP